MTFGGISEASGSAASSWKMSQSARYAERPHDARKYSIHGGKLAPIHGTVNASRYVGWRSPGRAGRASSAAAASAAAAALSSADVGDGDDGARALIRSFHVAWTVAAAAVAGAAVGAAGAAAVALRCVLYVCGPTVYRSVRACTRSRKLRKWFDEWWCKKPWTCSFISGVIIHTATCTALNATLASTRSSRKDARHERLHRRRRPCRDERWRLVHLRLLVRELAVSIGGRQQRRGPRGGPRAEAHGSLSRRRRRSSPRRSCARRWLAHLSLFPPPARARSPLPPPLRDGRRPERPRRCSPRTAGAAARVGNTPPAFPRRCHVERVLARPCSSVVRAEALHALGRRFEPCHGY